MVVEKNAPLQPCNTFGIAARAQTLVRVRSVDDLLAVLAEHKTAVLSRAQLLELVWGYDFAADTNVVDVFIGYLRRKLEAGGAPRLLHTVRGVGFVLRTQ